MNKVEIVILDDKFRNLAGCVQKITRQLFKLNNLVNRQVEIYLVSDRFMKKNALAFPAPPGFPRPDIGKKYKYLGEIYLNPDYIKKEHLEFPAKLAYMLIHSFLHLLGYDHKKKNDRIRMEKKEKFLLKRLIN